MSQEAKEKGIVTFETSVEGVEEGFSMTVRGIDQKMLRSTFADMVLDHVEGGITPETVNRYFDDIDE